MKNSSFFPYLILILILSITYYKFFIYSKIPFPGDLLLGSYSPWFDYYKIPIQNPLISDVFSQLFLWKYLSIDSFKLGQWPLWNPYSFMGTPFLATYQSATLYPFNLLLFLPKYTGWGVFILSQTLFALINMYIFLLHLVKSKLPAIFGAIIFAFGGLMTTWLEWGIAVHAMAWLPLCFYSIEKFLQSGKIRYGLLIITSLVLTALAGNAQITTYSFVLVSLYFCFSVWSKDLKLTIYRISPLFIILLLAILLCAIQLVPSFDLLKKSIRPTESYTQENNFGLLPIKEALRFFIADFFGNPVTRNYWGYLNYLETSGFAGTLTLPLIIYSYVFLKKGRKSLFFLILLPLSLILAFNNPISSFIYQLRIPLLTSSYASRILFISTFSISVLCAFSLAQITQNQKEKNKFPKTILWAWAVILGIIVGTILSQFIVWDIKNLESNSKYLETYLKDGEYSINNYTIALKNSILPLSLISFLLLVIYSAKIRFIKHKTPLVCVYLLLFLTFFDLGRYFLKFNPFVPRELIFPKVSAIDFLSKQPGLFRIGREHVETLPPNTWIAYNLQSYEGYDPIYLSQYGKFMHFLNGGDIRKGNSSRYAELTSRYSSPYLDSANNKFFIAIPRDENGYIPGDLLSDPVKEANFNQVFKDKSAAILENPNAKERAYFASSVVILPENKIMDLMMDNEKFDPRETIALSKNLQINLVSGKGEVNIDYYSPNLVKLNTNTKSDEVLILADQYEEGWHAKIDGENTLISPANLIFRAIKIPAGSHQITFNYWPKSFDIGLKISIATLFVIFSLSLFCVKIKRF